MELSGKAWLGLAAGVAAYDILSPEGQTLSEGVDKALENHPILTAAAIGGVALHLLNLLPPQIDPLHQILRIVK